jgi:two-component system invasion response regulator UvrY
MYPCSPLRILLVDDHPFMRSALRSAFTRNNAFTVTGVAENFQRAVESAATLTPDIVLTDIYMQPTSGIELTRYFARTCPAATVIGFSNTFLRRDIDAMKAAGAAGVILKGVALRELYHTIIRLYERRPTSRRKLYDR